MTPSFKKLLFSKQFRTVVSAIVGLIAAYFISVSDIGKVVEMNALDIQFRIAQNSRTPDTNIVIITIDQNSLQYFKRTAKISWPWPRDFYAMATEYLSKAGAKAVVYDFQFTEPDEDRANSVGAFNDSLFAAAMKNAGSVYLAAILSKQGKEDQPGDPLVKFPSTSSSIAETQKFDFDKSYSPLIQYQEAAKSIGVVNFVPDEDGVCRRIALQYSYQGKNLYALSYNVYKDLFGSTKPIEQIVTSPYVIYWYGKGGPDGVFKYYSIQLWWGMPFYLSLFHRL